MTGQDPMQSFYAAQRARPVPQRTDASRSYRSLSLVATAFLLLGGVVGVFGLIAVFISAAEAAEIDSDGAFITAVIGILFVVLVAAFYVAMGQLLHLMVDLQDNTHRTAIATEALDETLDELQELLQKKAQP